MAKFYLKNDWFAPDGSFWTAARVTPVEIPDHLVPFLPKTAEADDGKARNNGRPVVPMMNISVRGYRPVTSADVLAAKAATEVNVPAPVASEPAPAELPPEAAVAEVAATAEGDAAREAEVAAPNRKRRG